MKKLFPIIILLAFVLLPQSVNAGTLTESCFPVVYCPAGQDAYAGGCKPELNSVDGNAPSCRTINGDPAAEKYWAFSCDAGCYQKSTGGGSVNPCPGGIMVGGNCLIKLNILDDNVHATNKAYKIWDGTYLTEVVHVGTNGCADDEIAVSDSTSDTDWKCAPKPTGYWDVSGDNIFNNNIGNVGIGINNPVDELHIHSTGTESYSPWIRLTNNNTGAEVDDGSRVGIDQNGNFEIRQYETGKYISLMNANVGIGTTTPGSKLQVNGNAAIGYNASTAAPANGLVVSGNVGIGTTTPAATTKFTIVGTTSSTASALHVQNSSSTSLLFVRDDGNVGIGITAPTAKLEVVGQVKITGGDPDAGKVLTSDATGLATWETPAAAAGIGQFVGLSGSNAALPYTNVYIDAHNACSSYGSGAHVCSSEEMLYAYQISNSLLLPTLSNAWYNSGSPTNIQPLVSDCKGWTEGVATYFGTVWNFNIGAAGVQGCNSQWKFACCK